MKKCYVSSLHDGARVDDIFLICDKSLRQARNGSLFIRAVLRDRTGAIDAVKWDATEAAYAELPVNDFVHVRGMVSRHDGRPQVTVDSFRRCVEKPDPSDFLPRCGQDIDVMLAEMREIIESVREPRLKALLDHFFQNEEFVARFSTAPAAQKIHHAYIGGLLEHTLSVAKMCDFAARHYGNVDRDLLVAAAVLHDVGKIEEFCWDKSIGYSTSGHLIGHIVAGATMVKEAMDRIGGFEPLVKMMVIHMILSHHGEKEFGSPKRPKSIESIILHYLEDLDAKVNTFQQAVGDGEIESEADLWTDRHWVFGRPLFRGMPKSHSTDQDAGRASEGSVHEDYDPFAED